MENKNRIYLDLEYIYPGMTKESGRPSINDLRQVVQIAAIKVNVDTNEEIENFNKLCIPTYTKILPPFFIELTHITQDDVDKEGIPFLEAFKLLEKFCGNTEVYTMDKDYEVLTQNLGYYNLKNPLKEFTRVKPMLSSWGLDDTKFSSGTLYKAVPNAPKDFFSGHVHNALHDVRSMALASYYFGNNFGNK